MRAPRRAAGVHLLAALAVILTVACGGGSESAPQAWRHDLLFDGEDGQGQRLLHVMDLDTGVARPYGPGLAGTRGSLRPGSRGVAFASLPSDQAPAQLLWHDPGQGAGVLPLTGDPALHEREPAWSPDGRWLAFHSQREDAAGDVFTARFDGSRLLDLRNLTPRQPGDPLVSPDVTPAWSPDGAWIAFTSYRAGSPALWRMDPDGGQATQLTATSQAWGDYFPSWSPDGRSLAFQRIGPDGSRIGILDLGTGALRFLPFDGRAYAPAWSPDGAWIAFSGLVTGEQDLFLQRPDGSGLRRYPRRGADHGPSWVPRGAG